MEFLHEPMGYSIKEMCIALKLNGSSYYKWKKRKQSKSELLNIQITEYRKDFYEESSGVFGYRQICIAIMMKREVFIQTPSPYSTAPKDFSTQTRPFIKSSLMRV